MTDELLDAYRWLVAELLLYPTRPCLHEGTDRAVYDFDNWKTAAEYDEDPRRILQRLRLQMDSQ